MNPDDTAPAAPPARRVSKPALLLLTFFLGALGGHKIYLRRYTQAALYPAFLLFAFVPALVALIEFLVYLFSSEDTLNKRYAQVFSAPPSKPAIASGVLILALMAGFLYRLIVPAYQDKLDRSRVLQALAIAKPWQAMIEGYYNNRSSFPPDTASMGPDLPPDKDESGYGTLTHGAGGKFTVTLSAKAAGLVGNTVVFIPALDTRRGIVKWDCTGGTLPLRIRPSQCRPQ
jgi:type IV pilus assembly protein PilA